MVRRLLIATVPLITLGFILGCGGIMDQATRQAYTEMFQDMQKEVGALPDSPEKQRLLTLAQRGETDSAEGRIDYMEIVQFIAEAEIAYDDGAITESEVAALETMYDEYAAE